MVDWDVIAPMIVAVVLILTAGGVLVLRPIAKRLSELLELYARERTTGLEQEVTRMRDLLETMNARLQLMEDRQDFTERLIGSGETEEAKGEGTSRGGPGGVARG
jgi:hypothetical protein